MVNANFAVKYRPQRLDDVVGQKVSVELVRAMLNSVVTNDASLTPVILSGPSGTGKTTLARIMGKMLNCSSPSENGDACGKCTSCIETMKGLSLTVTELDGGSNNKREDIERLLNELRYIPMGKYRVVIIDECQQLTQAAWTMLLKCVEEPPAKVLICFCTTDPQKVPDAIKTRCRIVKLFNVDAETIYSRLKEICQAESCEDIIIEDDALRLIARHANGSVRDAVKNIGGFFELGDISELRVREVLGIPDEENVFGMIKAVASNDVVGVRDTLDRLYHDGMNVVSLKNISQRICDDALILHYGGTINTATAGYMENLNDLCKLMDVCTVQQFIEVLSGTVCDYDDLLAMLLVLSSKCEQTNLLFLRVNELEEQVRALEGRIREIEVGKVSSREMQTSSINEEQSSLDTETGMPDTKAEGFENVLPEEGVPFEESESDKKDNVTDRAAELAAFLGEGADIIGIEHLGETEDSCNEDVSEFENVDNADNAGEQETDTESCLMEMLSGSLWQF